MPVYIPRADRRDPLEGHMTGTIDATPESISDVTLRGGAAAPTPVEPGDAADGALDESGAKAPTPAKKVAAKHSPRKSTAPRKASESERPSKPKRQRRTTLFPAATFEDALELATAVYETGAGQPVRRITLFDNLGKSPDSGASRQLITNSAKYGLTKGSYSSEFIELTDDGLYAVSEDTSPAARIRARFKLAIESVEVFKSLYDSYIGNRLPVQAVLIDRAREAGIPEEDATECVETFTVNTKFVGVLRSISGAERLLSIDTVIDDFLPQTAAQPAIVRSTVSQRQSPIATPEQIQNAGYESACFYISPIGEDGSEQRKHADLFMGALVEPALAEFGLSLVRADKIGEAGMITGQIIEHIVHSKLVIVDLSFHNPNVFYELALRHAVRRPIVQISRAADRLPFDIGQVRTIVVDTTDIYTLVPQLESLKAQIAAQIRKTLDETAEVENPLSIFAPSFWRHLPGVTTTA
ncbi:hypothetical protein H1W00_08985 [Aeromicrobium sp. Marseille-Q0843]|uniref:Uncharacterized protein n=1 Tax=Aeromicrobium phoceense TaxID=2754045 RepID=A0A838XFI9_9ACTN|nr:hypothetical protein [Aeromicrobium phoceense]MBA4608607.1 hypothetical protein [Aeromicrobium phoceense]